MKRSVYNVIKLRSLDSQNPVQRRTCMTSIPPPTWLFVPLAMHLPPPSFGLELGADRTFQTHRPCLRPGCSDPLHGLLAREIEAISKAGREQHDLRRNGG